MGNNTSTHHDDHHDHPDHAGMTEQRWKSNRKLMVACEEGNVTSAREAIEEGADVNIRVRVCDVMLSVLFFVFCFFVEKEKRN